MSFVPLLLDVIMWPVYVMSGVIILLAVALLAALVAVTVALVRRYRKKK